MAEQLKYILEYATSQGYCKRSEYTFWNLIP